MRKNSLIFVLIGAVILIGLYYFLRKDNRSTDVNVSNNSTQPEQKVIVVNYNSAETFTPQTTMIEEGQSVSLKVTSDIADEVHLHGYDLDLYLESGKEGEIIFTASKTGRFEFELEEHKFLLGVIEVYPK